MFQVTLTDGSEHSLPRSPFADLVRFERHFSKAEGRRVSSEELNGSPSAEYIAFLVWLQLKRANAVSEEDFEAFIERIDTIRIVRDPDPKGTPPLPSESPSPASSSPQA